MTANPLDGSENGAHASDGRFVAGNPGGPGRPPRTTEENYLRLLGEACPPEEWLEICGRAVTQAKNGDAKAREWLARHLLTKDAAQDERRAAFTMYVEKILRVLDDKLSDPILLSCPEALKEAVLLALGTPE